MFAKMDIIAAAWQYYYKIQKSRNMKGKSTLETACYHMMIFRSCGKTRKRSQVTCLNFLCTENREVDWFDKLKHFEKVMKKKRNYFTNLEEKNKGYHWKFRAVYLCIA